ncbi:MAG: hypothetical protein WCI88_10445, partial [Chloroflexota bacterium]
MCEPSVGARGLRHVLRSASNPRAPTLTCWFNAAGGRSLVSVLERVDLLKCPGFHKAREILRSLLGWNDVVL